MVMEIRSFPQDNCDLYQDQIDAILLVLGHPEAFVTDESTLGDFISCIAPKSVQQEDLDMIAAYLKREVKFNSKLWELAKDMKNGI